MVDIVPELIAKVLADFAENLPVADVKTYADANAYAQRIGEKMSNALKRNITKATLPNGKMHYNIADRVFNESLGKNYELISDAVEAVQKGINAEMGIGLKAVKPKINKSRIKGLVNKISDAEDFDDVSWLLGDPVVNFSRAVVDDGAKANFELQGKAGLAPKIIRTANAKCCEWCSDKVGTYEYPCPEEIYHRHEKCECNVEFHGGGKRQNVHSKKYL